MVLWNPKMSFPRKENLRNKAETVLWVILVKNNILQGDSKQD